MKDIMGWRHMLVAATAILAASAGHAAEVSGGSEPIRETNITNDINLTSGEPQIAIDPTNSQNIAIIEFAVGSEKLPAWSRNPLMDVRSEAEGDAGLVNTGRLQLSRDGGKTWTIRAAPAFDTDYSPGGGDPMIAYGPDGTLYAADEPFARHLKSRADLSQYSFVITASRDGGKTFTPPQRVGTPVDRPWLKVDPSTGTVYTVSTGFFNPLTKQRNKPVQGAIMDRWMVAWKPDLSARSEARRLGGPDFSVPLATVITAAHGVVAAAYALGGPAAALYGIALGGGTTSAPPSLKPLMKGGGECTVHVSCLFFQTSNDEGLHWTRHYVDVPLPRGVHPFVVNVAADPGRPGRYALGFLSGDSKELMSVVTDDSGETWSGPFIVPENASGADFKQWMDYGPTGVLGLIWRKQRDDLTPAAPPQQRGRIWGPAYDVYASISCDGGTSWLAAVKINAQASPAGSANQDDISYLTLDAHYAHLVWGDRRMLTKTPTANKTNGGIQAYYARVPFATLSKGQSCGRK
jgi:hypothetical protein